MSSSFQYTIPDLVIPASRDINDYFTKRNNVTIKPQIETHYNKNNIRRYLTAGTCTAIASIIYTNYNFDTVYDIDADIGQLTVALADKYKKVIATSNYPGYLKRNILSYKFTNVDVVDNATPTNNSVAVLYDVDMTLNTPCVYVLNTSANIPNSDFMKIGDAYIYMQETNPKPKIRQVSSPVNVDQDKVDAYIDYMEKLLDVDPEDRDLFFNAESRQIWRDAIVHKSVDPTHNYETLEHIGDKFANAVFTYYLLQLDPTLNESQLSNLNSHYMSKKGQGPISNKLHISDYIITNSDNIQNIRKQSEDVFESTIGAIITIGKDKGTKYIVKLMEQIFSAGPPDLSLGRGDPKSIFTQLIISVGIKRSDLKITKEEGDMKKFIISIPSELIRRNIAELTNQESIPEIIGVGVGNTKAKAEQEAYANAIDTLNIDEQEVTQYQQEDIVKLNDLKPYRDIYFNKLKTNGIVSVNRVMLPPPAPDTYYVQLVGAKSNGEKMVIGEAISGSLDKANVRAVLSFLNS